MTEEIAGMTVPVEVGPRRPGDAVALWADTDACRRRARLASAVYAAGDRRDGMAMARLGAAAAPGDRGDTWPDPSEDDLPSLEPLGVAGRRA